MHPVREKISTLYKEVFDSLQSQRQSNNTLVRYLVDSLRTTPQAADFYSLFDTILSNFDNQLPEEKDPYYLEKNLAIKKTLVTSLTIEDADSFVVTADECRLECYAMSIVLSQTATELESRLQTLSNFVHTAIFRERSVEEKISAPLLAMTWYGTSILEEAIRANNLFLIKHFSTLLIAYLSEPPVTQTHTNTLTNLLNHALKLTIELIKTSNEARPELHSLMNAIIQLQGKKVALTLEILSSILIYKVVNERDWGLWEHVKEKLAHLNEQTRSELLQYASEQSKLEILEALLSDNGRFLCEDNFALLCALNATTIAQRRDLVNILLTKKPTLLDHNKKAYTKIFLNNLKTGQYEIAQQLWSKHTHYSLTKSFAIFLNSSALPHRIEMTSALKPLVDQFLILAQEEDIHWTLNTACLEEQWSFILYILNKCPKTDPSRIIQEHLKLIAHAPSEVKVQLLTRYLNYLFPTTQNKVSFLRTASKPALRSQSMPPVASSTSLFDSTDRTDPPALEYTIALRCSEFDIESSDEMPEEIIPKAVQVPAALFSKKASSRALCQTQKSLSDEQIKQIIHASIVFEADQKTLKLFETAATIAQNVGFQADKLMLMSNDIIGKFHTFKKITAKKTILVEDLQSAETNALLTILAQAIHAQIHTTKPIQNGSARTKIEIETALLKSRRLGAVKQDQMTRSIARILYPNQELLQEQAQEAINELIQQYKKKHSCFDSKIFPYPDELVQNIQEKLAILKNSPSLRSASPLPALSKAAFLHDLGTSFCSTESHVTYEPMFSLAKEQQPLFRQSRSRSTSRSFSMNNDYLPLHQAFMGDDPSFHQRVISKFEQVLPVALCYLEDTHEAMALNEYIINNKRKDPNLSLESVIIHFSQEENGKYFSFVKEFITKLAQKLNPLFCKAEKINALHVMDTIKIASAAWYEINTSKVTTFIAN